MAARGHIQDLMGTLDVARARVSQKRAVMGEAWATRILHFHEESLRRAIADYVAPLSPKAATLLEERLLRRAGLDAGPLRLGAPVYSPLLGGHTPSTIVAEGITFVWDEAQGYYPSEDGERWLYMEDEVITGASWYEITPNAGF